MLAFHQSRRGFRRLFSFVVVLGTHAHTYCPYSACDGENKNDLFTDWTYCWLIVEHSLKYYHPSAQRCEGVGDAEGVLLDGVEDAVGRLLDIIQAYQSKNRLAKVLTSTLLKRRLEEADRAIDSATMRLIIIHKVEI